MEHPREVDEMMEQRKRHLRLDDEAVRKIGRGDEVFVRGEAVRDDQLEGGRPACAADVRWLASLGVVSQLLQEPIDLYRYPVR